MNNQSQPIAVQNVMDYLLAALENTNGHGRVFKIGGPQVMQYRELMLGYARLGGWKRGLVTLSCIPLWFMAFGVSLMTPVPYPIAHALIGGLSADSIVQHPEAQTVFPEFELIGFTEAARGALAHLRVERVWKSDGRLRHSQTRRFFHFASHGTGWKPAFLERERTPFFTAEKLTG